jgi:hypothetical protein
MTDGRCMHGGQVTVKLDLKEIMWECADWIIWLRTGSRDER